MQDITVIELKKRLDEGDNSFLFLDVREAYEYEAFNLGAHLIPLGGITEAANESLIQYKDSEIVVHCRSGARSGQAKMILEAMGYTQVRNVLGGVLDWQANFGA